MPLCTSILKVLQVDEESGGMQNIVISDGKATARITVWDDDVERLETDKEYKFSGVMMIRKAKSGKTCLSTAKTDCNIIEIDA